MVSTKTKSTGVIQKICFDGGNTGIKFTQSGSDALGIIPSYVKEIDLDVQDVDFPHDDPKSAVVEYCDQVYAVGALAGMLGGSPVFELGKAEYTTILLLAALRGIEQLSTCPVIEQVNILVPDARRQHLEGIWNDVSDEITSIQSFKVNGHEIRPQFRNVRFIPEGLPAFRWAMSKGLFTHFQETPGVTQCGILDIGGGETTFKLFDLGTGQTNWDVTVTLPGMSALAASIANRLKAQSSFRVTPETADILRCLAIQHYVLDVGGQGVNFEQEYLKARSNWIKLILQKLQSAISGQQGIGGVLVVGGGAHHAETIEQATSGRFFVASQDATGVDPRYINAIALGEM